MNGSLRRWKTTTVLGFVWIAVIIAAVPVTAPAQEMKFDVLQIGTHEYKNVTVTTKSKSYVFILHSEGMTNLRIAELPEDVLQKLGYQNPNAPKVQTNGPAVFVKQTIAKLDLPQVKTAEEQFKTAWNNSPAGARLPIPEISKSLLAGVAGALALLYIFYCACCRLICLKAGGKPGILIWFPLLQLIPMLKAAGMSLAWFLAYLVPVLNVIAHVLWCFKIADARGKTAFVGFLLLLPVTSFFAFLYLAFSNGHSTEKAPASGRIEIMTLETA